MKFDFTHGKKVRYMVSVHRWNVDDHMYFHNYKDAKNKFDELRGNKNLNEGTSINLYDVINDIRKMHYRF